MTAMILFAFVSSVLFLLATVCETAVGSQENSDIGQSVYRKIDDNGITDLYNYTTSKQCEKDEDCQMDSYCNTASELCEEKCKNDKECKTGLYCDSSSGDCCFYCRSSKWNRENPDGPCPKSETDCGDCVLGFIPITNYKVPCMKDDNWKMFPETTTTETKGEKQGKTFCLGVVWTIIAVIICAVLTVALIPSLWYIHDLRKRLTTLQRKCKCGAQADGGGPHEKDD